MTPKAKALELVRKFLTASHGTMEEYVPVPYIFAKQCALIAVNEIISIDVLIDEDTWVSKTSYLEYWKEVKKELEKI